MLRRLILVGLVVAFSFGVVGMTQEPVTIQLWHGMSRALGEAIDKLVADFMAEYPYITVESTYQGGYGDLHSKLDAAVVAGNTPTIAQVYTDWISPVKSILYPIGPQLTAEERADIVEGLLPANTFDGVLTTVPFNKSIMILYYNEDLVDTPPATWAEYEQMAKDLTADLDGDGVIDRYGTAFRPSNPEQFLIFLEQAGGSILNEDWTEVTINSAAGLEAMNFINGLVPYSFITNEYMSDHITEAAMFLDTSAGYTYNVGAATNAGFELGVARAPAGPVNGKSMVQGTNLVIYDTDNQTQAQKDAAILLVKFLLRPENTVYWAIHTGYQPVTKSGYQSQEWIDFVASHPYQVAMSEQMLDSFESMPHPSYGDIRSVIMTGWEEVLRGAETPEAALNYMAEEIEPLLQQ